MLDATGLGGPKITRSTPISMMFCTANSLNNPFQKDCAINKTWAADSNKPAPFGDYISFNKTEAYSQSIVAEVKAIAPTSCGLDYRLTAKIQDVLALTNGEVVTSVKAVEFYYWYDANGSGDADGVGGEWILASNASQVAGSINTWSVLTGTATLGDGESLSITVNGAIYDNVTVTGGNWSIDTRLVTVSSGTLGSFDNGVTYDVTATVTDRAGNVSVDTSSGELQIFSVDNNNDGFDDFITVTSLLLPDADGIADFQDQDDTDNDGIPDGEDLDDDNDGIPDNFEGDGLIDTDSDNIPDSLDLDSDNDSIFDVIESGGGDVDGDGILGSGIPVVNINGLISGSGLPKTDTDGDGIADYLDITDSDINNVIRTGLDGVGLFNPWLLVLLSPLICITRRSSRVGMLLVLFMLPMLSNADTEQKKNITETLLSRLYIGGGVGSSLITPETSDTIFTLIEDQDFGYKFYAGLDVTESVSAELSMADLGTAQLDPEGEISYFISSASVLYYFYDQGENDHKGWATFIKGGIGAIRNSATVLYQKENPVQLSLSGGIEYAWDNGLAARVELESFDEDASLLTIGMLYRFGKKAKKKPQPEDSDKDGVYDSVDQCPESSAGILVDENGCNIDIDGDGVLNILDQCPESEEAVPVDENGCDFNTDTDNDGVLNKQDQCPETPQGIQVDTRGCNIDNDGDGVLNEQDECQNTIMGAGVNAVGCTIFETKIEGINFKVRSSE